MAGAANATVIVSCIVVPKYARSRRKAEPRIRLRATGIPVHESLVEKSRGSGAKATDLTVADPSKDACTFRLRTLENPVGARIQKGRASGPHIVARDAVQVGAGGVVHPVIMSRSSGR